LSQLLVIVTAAALVLGLVVTINNIVPLFISVLVWCVLPTPLVICAIFGRGDLRAFAIGSLVPWVSLLSGRAWQSGLTILVWLVVMPLVCGIVAVLTYRWVVWRH
jgi:hypothetical protein